MTSKNKRFNWVFIWCLILIAPAFKTWPEFDRKALAAFDKLKVDGGDISGTKNTEGNVHIFKGIPFAAPPVGSLRWKSPQPVQPWSGTKSM